MSGAWALISVLSAVHGAPDVAECKGALEPSLPGGCQGVASLGCCDVQGRSLWCQGGDLYCLDCAAGFDYCGWNPLGYYDCGQAEGAIDPTGANAIGCDGCDPSCAASGACSAACPGACGSCATAGDVCLDDGTCYTPDCGDKQCGSDPLGVSCGACPVGTECVEGIYQCLAYPDGCVPKTSGGGCGGCPCEAFVCATYPTCCSGQWDVFCATACKDGGAMDCSPCPAAPSCDGLGCGSFCGVDCGTCASPAVCHDFQCCVPDCEGKACGDDGCGGACGACEGFDQCVGGQCQQCVPACDGKACGDDGCGGSCGSCAGGEVCAGGQCQVGYCGGQCGSDEPQDCGPGCTCYCNEDCFGFGDCCDQICTSCTTLSGCCTPDCGDKACGDDGCGGSCGDCPEGDVCEGGACVLCVPDCTGLACGDDGCGGSCGACPLGEGCDAGACEGCDDGLSWIGCCEGGVAHWCQDGQPQSQACADSCGWDFTGSFYNCGFSVAEPTGAHPYDCDGDCTPQCDGKTCGGDGCGGDCGTCPSSHACVEGVCVEGNCGAVTGAGCCTADSVLFCQQGQLQGYPCLLGQGCGWDDGKGAYNCGFGGEDPSGVNPLLCCTPQCDGKACGDDGCGGSCGSCAASQECKPDGACGEVCVADWCADKQCGDDTCGGSCGSCQPGWECKPDQRCLPTAACVPQCDGKTCGDDGCGAVCGWCGDGAQCDSSGNCVAWECAPDCGGATCGSDGCWGHCGVCDEGHLCISGVCEKVNLCSQLPAGGRCDGSVAVSCRGGNTIVNEECPRYGKVCAIHDGEASCVVPSATQEPSSDGDAVTPPPQPSGGCQGGPQPITVGWWMLLLAATSRRLRSARRVGAACRKTT